MKLDVCRATHERRLRPAALWSKKSYSQAQRGWIEPKATKRSEDCTEENEANEGLTAAHWRVPHPGTAPR